MGRAIVITGNPRPMPPREMLKELRRGGKFERLLKVGFARLQPAKLFPAQVAPLAFSAQPNPACLFRRLLTLDVSLALRSLSHPPSRPFGPGLVATQNGKPGSPVLSQCLLSANRLVLRAPHGVARRLAQRPSHLGRLGMRSPFNVPGHVKSAATEIGAPDNRPDCDQIVIVHGCFLHR